MRSILLLVLMVIVLLAFSGCNFREREEALKKRETALNEREQELILKEKTFLLKEKEVLKKEEALDSSRNADSSHILNPILPGTWNVKMTCTETTCAGSAVGDTKNETWQLAYQGNSILAKAMVNNQLVRVYTGFYTGNTVELVEDKTSVVAPSKAVMVVRLRIVDKAHLEGEREIARENNCKVVYAVQFEKTTE